MAPCNVHNGHLYPLWSNPAPVQRPCGTDRRPQTRKSRSENYRICCKIAFLVDARRRFSLALSSLYGVLRRLVRQRGPHALQQWRQLRPQAAGIVHLNGYVRRSPMFGLRRIRE
jgi:hypothetical protein